MPSTHSLHPSPTNDRLNFSPHSSQPDTLPLPQPPDHSMIMRSKAGIFKPKTYLVTLLSTPTEPTSVCQALPDPKWFQAIKEEYGSL